MNPFYVVGVFMFVLVLKRVSFVNFYKALQPVSLLALGALGFPVWLNNQSQTTLAVTSTATTALTYFFFVYSRYAGLAVVPYAFTGAYTLVVGSVMSTVDLLLYVAMREDVNNQVLLTIAYTSLALCIAYSVYFGHRATHALEKSGSGFC